METLAQMVFNEENIRTLVIIVAMACGFILQYLKIEKKIDDKIDAFHKMLKSNDFAHLNSTIKELTFMLEKNGFLSEKDRVHIDSRLDT